MGLYLDFKERYNISDYSMFRDLYAFAFLIVMFRELYYNHSPFPGLTGKLEFYGAMKKSLEDKGRPR